MPGQSAPSGRFSECLTWPQVAVNRHKERIDAAHEPYIARPATTPEVRQLGMHSDQCWHWPGRSCLPPAEREPVKVCNGTGKAPETRLRSSVDSNPPWSACRRLCNRSVPSVIDDASLCPSTVSPESANSGAGSTNAVTNSLSTDRAPDLSQRRMPRPVARATECSIAGVYEAGPMGQLFKRRLATLQPSTRCPGSGPSGAATAQET